MSPLISKQEWKSLFDRELYVQVIRQKALRADDQRVRAHSLKYLAALNQDHTSLIPQIEQREQDDPQFKSAFTKLQFTLLHILVLRGVSLEVLELLLGKNVNVNERDAFGWTPLHHAAFVSTVIANKLIEKGADQKLTNRLGGTYADLCRLSGAKKSVSPHSLFFQDDAGNERKVTGPELAQLTGLKFYTDDCLVQKPLWPLIWKGEPGNLNDWAVITGKYFFNKLKRVTQLPLLVKKSDAIAHAKGFGVFTKSDLPENCLIGEYVGEVTNNLNQNFVDVIKDMQGNPMSTEGYLMGAEHFAFNAGQKGNVVRFVNDGWANCRSVVLANMQGLSNRIFLVTSEPISAGEELVFSYGTDGAKWLQHTVIRLDKMTDFIKKHKILDLVKIVIQLNQTLTNRFSVEDAVCYRKHYERMWYLTSTPSVLIRGVLSNWFSGNELDQVQLMRVMMGSKPNIDDSINSMLYEVLIDFEARLTLLKKKGDTTLANHIRKTIFALLPKARMFDIAGFILAINTYIFLDVDQFIQNGTSQIEKLEQTCLEQWKREKNPFIYKLELLLQQAQAYVSSSSTSGDNYVAINK